MSAACPRARFQTDRRRLRAQGVPPKPRKARHVAFVPTSGCRYELDDVDVGDEQSVGDDDGLGGGSGGAERSRHKRRGESA